MLCGRRRTYPESLRTSGVEKMSQMVMAVEGVWMNLFVVVVVVVGRGGEGERGGEGTERFCWRVETIALSLWVLN